MTLPADDTAGHRKKPRSTRAKRKGRSAAPSAGAGRAAARSSAPSAASQESSGPLDDQIDARLAELAERQSELQRREQEIAQQQRLLDQYAQQVSRQDAQSQRAQSEAHAKDLKARAAELDRRQQLLERLEQSLIAQRKTQNRQRAAIEERLKALEDREAAHEQRRAEVRRALAEKSALLHRRKDELAEQVQLARAEIERRQQALARERKALDEQLAVVEGRCVEAAQGEAETEKRRAAVDRLYQQAAETQQHAERQQGEVAALKRQLEAREAELRRDSLQAELDREHVERERTALSAEHQRLAELQAEAERELDRLRTAGEQRGEPSPTGRTVPTIPTAGLWRRGLVFCGVAGLAAGLAWFAVEQPRYRGLAEVRIASERDSLERITSEHAGWLMSDAVVEHWQGSPPVEAWIAARADRRVSTHPLPETGTVQLTLDTADETLAETLLAAAAKSYGAYVDSLPLGRFRSPRLIEWQAALEDELTRLRGRRQEIRARLAQAPGSSARNEAEAAFQQTLNEFKRVVERLREQRDQLVVLRSQELPRGEVTDEAYQQALAADAIYQEDLKEFRSEVRQYQTELAGSMLLLLDPLQELRQSVRSLAATMVEQRDLHPPPNVRVVLEQCLADVGDLQRWLAEFSQTWDRRRETVGHLNASAQVVELVDQQHQAADAAGRLVEAARRVPDELSARVEELVAEGNAGTRELVVASVLRGGLSRLTEQVGLFAEAAGATDLSVNFRLDAHDRQLRGLRTRLRDRQQRVREWLQVQADAAARAEHDKQERRLRESVSELDDRRQALMDTLVAQLERLRELDERNQELRKLAAELRAEEAAIARLESRLAELKAEQAEPGRDSIELVESRHEQTAGVHRLRNAILAGLVTFAAVGLLLSLMFVQRPRPRRP